MNFQIFPVLKLRFILKFQSAGIAVFSRSNTQVGVQFLQVGAEEIFVGLKGPAQDQVQLGQVPEVHGQIE